MAIRINGYLYTSQTQWCQTTHIICIYVIQYTLQILHYIDTNSSTVYNTVVVIPTKLVRDHKWQHYLMCPFMPPVCQALCAWTCFQLKTNQKKHSSSKSRLSRRYFRCQWCVVVFFFFLSFSHFCSLQESFILWMKLSRKHLWALRRCHGHIEERRPLVWSLGPLHAGFKWTFTWTFPMWIWYCSPLQLSFKDIGRHWFNWKLLVPGACFPRGPVINWQLNNRLTETLCEDSLFAASSITTVSNTKEVKIENGWMDCICTKQVRYHVFA